MFTLHVDSKQYLTASATSYAVSFGNFSHSPFVMSVSTTSGQMSNTDIGLLNKAVADLRTAPFFSRYPLKYFNVDRSMTGDEMDALQSRGKRGSFKVDDYVSYFYTFTLSTNRL